MPDIVVHRNMGRAVSARLDFPLNEDIFHFGLLGPDPYLFYHFYLPPFRHPVNRYSSVMHRQRTGDFLIELAKRCSDWDGFSFLAGFLCHYTLDATMHPYIIEKAKHSPAMHLAIEHRLDNLDGGAIDIPPFPPEKLRPMIGGAIRKLYGWPDAWEKLKAGHADMAPFYRLAEDKGGYLDAVLGWTKAAPAMLSYRSKVCDDMDLSGFKPLCDQAVEQAVDYIRAAEAYVRGAIDEEALRGVIGNRSYIDG